MKTRIVGDIHGKINDFRFYSLGIGRSMKAGESYDLSIQIGDYGLGFSNSQKDQNINEWMKENPQHRFIRGNHDNPAVCKEMAGWIPDGTVEGDVMYIGGAWSIDNPNAPPGWYQRTENVDWWADEQCSDDQFQQMLKRLLSVKQHQ